MLIVKWATAAGSFLRSTLGVARSLPEKGFARWKCEPSWVPLPRHLWHDFADAYSVGVTQIRELRVALERLLCRLPGLQLPRGKRWARWSEPVVSRRPAGPQLLRWERALRWAERVAI